MEQSTYHAKAFLTRSCLLVLLPMAACVGLSAIGMLYLRQEYRLSGERQQAQWRQDAFDRIKNGEHRALITDSQLLPMLANDADCVANLDQLDFSTTQITAEDARYIAELSNVKSLSFYDTRGADDVLENACSLPIQRLGFEMTRLSEDSLRALAEFPELTAVHFEHIMSSKEIAILQSLPPRIKVRTPDPEEDEPG